MGGGNLFRRSLDGLRDLSRGTDLRIRGWSLRAGLLPEQEAEAACHGAKDVVGRSAFSSLRGDSGCEVGRSASVRLAEREHGGLIRNARMACGRRDIRHGVRHVDFRRCRACGRPLDRSRRSWRMQRLVDDVFQRFLKNFVLAGEAELWRELVPYAAAAPGGLSGADPADAIRFERGRVRRGSVVERDRVEKRLQRRTRRSAMPRGIRGRQRGVGLPEACERAPCIDRDGLFEPGAKRFRERVPRPD
jgi:hypothetical protein